MAAPHEADLGIVLVAIDPKIERAAEDLLEVDHNISVNAFQDVGLIKEVVLRLKFKVAFRKYPGAIAAEIVIAHGNAKAAAGVKAGPVADLHDRLWRDHLVRCAGKSRRNECNRGNRDGEPPAERAGERREELAG